MRKAIERYPFFFIGLIAAVSIALHWDKFPLDLAGVHSWRQAQTQQNIQNFYREDFNILNPRVNSSTHQEETPTYRYEFPIMQWGIALVYKVTGESFMVTRIMVFLIGLCSVACMFFLLKYLLGDVQAALAGAWAFNFSPVFFYFTTCPIPDNLALCGAIGSLAFFFRFTKTQSWRNALLSAFMLSLGTAAKLPYILFAAPPAFYILSAFFKKGISNSSKETLLALIYFAWMLPTFAWYAWVIPTWNNGIVQGVFESKMTTQEILNTLDYHLKTMFPERLTNWGAVPLLLAGCFYAIKKKAWQQERFWMLASMGLLIFAYWGFEFNMIGIVHDYYMMPFLLPLFILIAYGVKQLLAERHKVKWFFLAFLLTLPSFAFNYTKRDWTPKKAYYNQDLFRYKEDLKNAAPPGSKCIIIQDPLWYVFSYIIDKRGFVFTNEYLPGHWVEDLRKNYGVTYMYSSSRKVDEDPEVAANFEELVMERGEIKVFKLKTD
ncbi:MAG: glycosyltransferase family 39 protein [Saprospiraceae bacterium]